MNKRRTVSRISVTLCCILFLSCFVTVKADTPDITPYSSSVFSSYSAYASCPGTGKITGSIWVSIRSDIRPAVLAGVKYMKLQYLSGGTWTTERTYPQAYSTGCNEFSKTYNLTATSGRTYRFAFTMYGLAGGESSEVTYYSNSVYIR